MIVPYTRFLSFLMNGINCSYKENLYYIKDNLEFRFDQYVLSQMHLGILCHLLKRNLYTVYHVYRWVEESVSVAPAEVSLVLKWYYQDLSGFFRSIAYCEVLKTKTLQISVPVELLTSLGLTAVSVDFAQEKDLILKTIDTGVGDYSRYINLGYKEFVSINSIFTSEEQLDRFITSIILAKYADTGEIIRW